MATKDPIALAVGDQASATGVFPEDHKRQKKRPPKWVRVLRLVGTFGVCAAMCYAEFVWSRQGEAHDPGEGVWGYVARGRPGAFRMPGVYPLYGLVLLVNVVCTTLLMVFFLGFYIVIGGRRKHGY